MKGIYLQDKKFYFFAFYTFLSILWLIFEILFLTTNLKIIHDNEKIIAFFEIFIGLFSIGGIYFLLQDIKNSEIEINKAKATLTVLKEKHNSIIQHKDSPLNKLITTFKNWNLSESEKEVAILILRGLTHQQIAGVRNRSLRTIESQTFSIYQKAGVTGKVEFISYFVSDFLPEED